MNPISPDADGQQTEWCVHYKRVGKRWADRKYYHREWTARRYAARLVALVDRYDFVEIQSRPVGRWRTVDRVYQGPIEPIDWDETWAQWERKRPS
jgi:hypothetical protein